ncbi:carbohydrate ABC transporter permease [Paenibacillus gansuensis]|uniref:Carbohydrate ABC transporter permease n=1 Tax=Paenibacillus gansuensis TaxID=306542 RepID=A0ABW5PCK1_9BACL
MNPNFGKATGFERIFVIGLYMFMTLFCISVLYPFMNIMALSFNQGVDALKGGITIWPRKFTLENYRIIFDDPTLYHAIFVSVSRTVIGTLTALFFTSLVAFCLTKERLVGYHFYLILFLLPMYITAGIIPTYLLYKGIALTDSFWVYIIPNLVWAYNVIIMRTFFKAIPASLTEASMMDGASEFTVFFRIIVPLSTPVIATIALYNAVWNWNSWLDTVLFTRSTNLDTLMSLLSKMLMEQQSNQIATMKSADRVQYLTPQVLKAAMTMVTTIPIILVYPFLQKYFVKGVMIGAVKG